jgi:type III pantothenate kinase
MLLAIEQGNTNTLFAVHDGKTWIAQWRAATESSRTADEYAVWALPAAWPWAGLQLGAFDACIISSVVPQSIFNLRNLARRYLHVEPLVVGENVDSASIRIDKPSEAGADRLVNALGAHVGLFRGA